MVVVLAAAAALAAAVAATALCRTWFDRRLHALFEGPEVTSTGAPTGFTSHVVYDLSEYADPWTGEGDNGALPASVTDPSPESGRPVDVTAPAVYRERLAPQFLTVTYPADGAVFPPNLCAPFIEWSDRANDLWQVTLSIPRPSRTWVKLSHARRWRVPEDVWREVLTCAPDQVVTLQVRGVRRSGLWGRARPDVHLSRPVRFRVSADPADNVVVYRLIDPPFINRKTPDTFVRDIRTLRTTPLIRGHREYCINCHTFSSRTGRRGRMAIQVRYGGSGPDVPRIYLALCNLETGEVFKPLMPFTPSGTTFMSWSPDGTRLALSAKHKVTAGRPQVHGSLPTVQANADIAVYDVSAGKAWLLPGASEKGVLELYPWWTPDGRSVVFAAAPEGLDSRYTRLGIHVVPYADGRGGRAEPVPGASDNGRSNYYPRFSPDGKWFSFVQSDGGTFVKSSSDLYLMPADFSRPPGRLESNAPCAADSWYSWSSNCRWIVFATKRDDGAFARLYFTHIDDAGHASVPVRLPIAEEVLMSFNVPESVTDVPSVDEPTLFDGLRVERPTVPISEADGGRKDD